MKFYRVSYLFLYSASLFFIVFSEEISNVCMETFGKVKTDFLSEIDYVSLEKVY